VGAVEVGILFGKGKQAQAESESGERLEANKQRWRTTLLSKGSKFVAWLQPPEFSLGMFLMM
jgi:hypothetical protein